jgi:hypothetical protein
MGEHAMEQHFTQRLADLLAGGHGGTGDDLDSGAQLVVTDPDGTEVFRAPLARHHRFDRDDAQVLWVRPVVVGERSAQHGGEYVFNVSVNRRRGLAFAAASVDDRGDVVLDLPGGQTARIQPAAGAQLDELYNWDEFTLNILTAEEELDLYRLDTDSWYGRFG